MHRVFRLRHLLLLAAVLSVGIFPIFAFPGRSVGPTADDFAIIGSNVQVDNGIARIEGDITAGPGFGNANIAADDIIETGGGQFTSDGIELESPSSARAATAISELGAADDALFNTFNSIATNIAGNLNGQVLQPGVYRIAGDASLTAGQTLTFDGDIDADLEPDGDYIICVDGGGLNFAGDAVLQDISPANITWIVNNANSGDDVVIGAGATFFGRVITTNEFGGNFEIQVDDTATINGRLFAADSGDILFEDSSTLTDCGNPAPVVVSNIQNLTQGQPAGVVQIPGGIRILICVGDTLRFDLSSIDAPDNAPQNVAGSGNVTLQRRSPLVAPAGYSENPPLPVGPAAPATSQVTFTPGAALGGTVIPFVYRSVDLTNVGDGTICDFLVEVLVSNPPVIDPASNISGETPFQSGSGDPGDPITVCEDQVLQFDIVVNDVDPGDQVELQYAITDGSPAGSLSLQVINPVNTPVPQVGSLQDPVTTSTGLITPPVTVRVTWDPVAADANECFEFTLRASDAAGCITDREFAIYTVGLPQFDVPPTPINASVVTACVGESLHYRVQASPDAIDTDCFDVAPEAFVQISAAGIPVGASHDPNFLGVDTLGPFSDDLLTIPGIEATAGNPSITDFEWLPTPGDVGIYPIIYTAEDSFGCTVTHRVEVHVTNRPVFSGLPANGQVFRICPGQTLDFNPGVGGIQNTVSATDPDGDTVQLSAVVTDSIPGGTQPTFVPALPTSAAGTVATNVNFTPNAGDAGSVFTFTFTALDLTNNPTPGNNDPTTVQCTPNATLTFTVIVENVPVITVSPNAGPFNLCTGEELEFRVRATDADADQEVTLSVAGALPPGITFTPTLPTNENPVETVVRLTAQAPIGGNQTFNLTFTATDPTGCSSSQVVTINISDNPTVTLSNFSGAAPLTSGNGTAGNPFVVCVGSAFTYTVTADDPSVTESLTLNSSGDPTLGQGYDEVPDLPITGAAGAAVVTNVNFTPVQALAGQTIAITYSVRDNFVGNNNVENCTDSETIYIRVSDVPDITVTNQTEGFSQVVNGPNSTQITVCEGKLVKYRVRAVDTDLGDPGEITLDSSGDPASGYLEVPLLPTTNQGNVETNVTFQTPAVAVDTNFVITYTATDADGCTSSHVVTVRVLNEVPTTITLEPAVVNAQVDEQVCLVATVLNQCQEPMEGQPVLFIVNGTTGSNQKQTILTDANGQSQFCYVPPFPGTDTVTAVVDTNGNQNQDGGEISDTSTVNVSIANSGGAFASGSGTVDVTGFATGAPTPANFNLDVRNTQNGKAKGSVSFTILGIRPQFRVNSTKIESLTVTQQVGGANAVIFGVAKVSGFPPNSGFSGTQKLRFRVDAWDRGTPGVPVDRFVITFINPVTGNPIPPGSMGGNLQWTIGKGVKGNNDIKIQTGVPVP